MAHGILFPSQVHQDPLVLREQLAQRDHREQLDQVARLGRQALQDLLAPLVLPDRLAQCSTPHISPVNQPPQTLARYG